jgi:hypothetical protein
METWEKENNITADRFKDHHGYYLQLSKAMGIGWNDKDRLFVRHTVEYWKRKYAEDKHLNNHPLYYFDICNGYHQIVAARKGIPWSKSNTVCCLKAVIIEKVLKS